MRVRLILDKAVPVALRLGYSGQGCQKIDSLAKKDLIRKIVIFTFSFLNFYNSNLNLYFKMQVSRQDTYIFIFDIILFAYLVNSA